MSSPDMRTPIAYSLAWPERMSAPTKKLDLAELGQLTFEKPDETRFPALRIAKEILKAGNKQAPILNAANEVAVEAFLNEKIKFMSIPKLIEMTLDKSVSISQSSEEDLTLEEILSIDRETRVLAQSLLKFMD